MTTFHPMNRPLPPIGTVVLIQTRRPRYARDPHTDITVGWRAPARNRGFAWRWVTLDLEHLEPDAVIGWAPAPTRLDPTVAPTYTLPPGYQRALTNHPATRRQTP